MTSFQIPDIPRAYTGLAEWMACILFAIQLKRRLPWKRWILCALCALAVQCLFLVVTDNIPIYL